MLTPGAVFTLFVDGGRIAGRMLQDANIDFLYYFGSMSHVEKHKVVQDFAEKKNIRVLVSDYGRLSHRVQV
jgi:SNF2 family DNA or RNA helicase